VSRPVRVLELRSVRGTGGGPEKTILLGAARHDPAVCAVTVCYVRDVRDDVFAIDRRAGTARVSYTEVRERHSLDPSVWAQLLKLVRSHDIDIVHAHEYKTDFLAWLLAKRTGIVPLATAHGWTGESAKERFVYYPADKRLLSRFPKVIAVSHEIRDTLVRSGAKPDRVEVLLNGIDPQTFRRMPERRHLVRTVLGIPESRPVIGAVGRLERQKRFDLLLDAFAHTPTRAHLVIVGDGSLRGALQSQAHMLGIGQRCHFLGHCDDVADLHNAFDVLVQSSDYEGTPNAVLEAMALETPLVATEAGGTADLVTSGVHGLLVPTRDPASLCRAITHTLDDRDQAHARARSARLRVETELSFEARTRRLETIYQELLEHPGGNRPPSVPSRGEQPEPAGMSRA
jgi:glycosyltransferase involved in cell wall biosynthesis